MNARIAKESVLFLALLLGGTLGGPALSSSGQVSAQADSFRARLSPLPVNRATVSTITGVGQVRATLDGNQLTVTGTYRGMSSPATAAHLHNGRPGQPGPLAQGLDVSTSPEGEIAGTVELTDEQVAALRAQSLYVQVHSEGNPAGELRGWIFDTETIGEEPANMELESLTVANLMRDFVPVTDEKLRNPDPADWPMIRGNYQAWSYSPLDHINAGNVDGLRLEWVWNMHEGSSEPAPLVYGGVIYLINPGNVIQALDGRTGDLIWEHASGPENGQDMRGIAIYQDKIIQGTTDARLVALDARTGELVWETQIQEGNSNSSGPMVADGKVISGLGGCARYGEARCFISAHDANTGELVWRFNTIAEAEEPGGDTWTDLDNIFRKGGETWITGSYDPELNLTYWGTAQAKPWVPVSRHTSIFDGGLYTNSTVAVNVETGELEWYFQHVPGEALDLDEVFERVLVDRDGRRLVLSIGKHGILWKNDRESGEFPGIHRNGLSERLHEYRPRDRRDHVPRRHHRRTDRRMDTRVSEQRRRKGLALHELSRAHRGSDRTPEPDLPGEPGAGDRARGRRWRDRRGPPLLRDARLGRQPGKARGVRCEHPGGSLELPAAGDLHDRHAVHGRRHRFRG